MTDAAPRPLYPGKAGLRRNILLVPSRDGIRADVEDDFHEFGIELSVEHDRIVDVRTDAGRTPWSSCAEAGGFLAERLAGLALEQVAGFDNPLLHCTHQFDLALIAVAHVHDKAPTLFEMFVSDPADGQVSAELRRDGEFELSWRIEATRIVSPAAFAGRDLKMLREWQGTLEARTREAALMLRRAAFIARGRSIPSELLDPAMLNQLQVGACYNFQPERIGRSIWHVDRRRDFTDSRTAPLASRISALREDCSLSR